jgi:hypothetical protein
MRKGNLLVAAVGDGVEGMARAQHARTCTALDQLLQLVNTGWRLQIVCAVGDELVKPVAVRSTRGAWYRSWRLVSLDGSTFDVADEKANEDALSARSKPWFQRISANPFCIPG